MSASPSQSIKNFDGLASRCFSTTGFFLAVNNVKKGKQKLPQTAKMHPTITEYCPSMGIKEPRLGVN